MSSSINSVSVIDITYSEDDECSLIEWIHMVGKLCVLASTSVTRLRLMIMWIPAEYLPTATRDVCLSTLCNLIPHDWTIQYVLCNAVDYGDVIDANRYVFYTLSS